jgi:hypothetical protein
MSTSIETMIVELHLQHFVQKEIAAALRTGRDRVSRCLREFHHSSAIPDSHGIGRRSIRGSELIAFMETRTLQGRSLSVVNLAHEVSEHLSLAISRWAVNVIRRGMPFKSRG